MNNTPTTTAPTTLNKTRVLAWAKQDGKALVELLVIARAYAMTERERVNAIRRPIFDRYQFRVCAEFATRGRGTELITSPENIYLAGDIPEVDHYFAELDAAHRANGWHGEPGSCPALTAEHEVLKLEWEIIRQFSEVSGFDFNPINCRLDLRRRFLDMVVGLAMCR